MKIGYIFLLAFLVSVGIVLLTYRPQGKRTLS